MQPNDPIVGGTILRRVAIASPNYTPGSSGWSINGDGSAEFNDATIRGVLDVLAADGSEVRILGSGGGARILLTPAPGTGTYTPGSIVADVGSGAPIVPEIAIQSPQVGANLTALLAVSGNNGAGTWPASIVGEAEVVHVTAGTGTWTGPLDVSDALTTAGDQVCGSEVGTNNDAVTSGTDDTVSAPFVNMAGTGSVTTMSFVKRFAGTAIRLGMGWGLTAVTNNVQVRGGIRLNGTDYVVTKRTIALAGQYSWPSGFLLVPAGTVPAGTYTCQARWQVTAGAGTARRDTNTYLWMSAREVSA